MVYSRDAVHGVNICARLVSVILGYYGATNHNLRFKACCTNGSDGIVDLRHCGRHQGTNAYEGRLVVLNGLYDDLRVNILAEIDDFVTIIFK